MKIKNDNMPSQLIWNFEQDQSKYSKYFNSCKGVFQGGGCKAIAYIGAYKRAHERGVFFSELAGTSAGSIVAAMIAAGASPEQIYDIVKKTNFSELIQSVGKQHKLLTLYLSPLLGRLPTNIKKYISKEAISRFGIFDSKKIEKFVEDCLFQISGKHNLKFSQLVPDLNIVCADLQSNKMKLWNKQNTPEEPIAKAVSASCSIPIFFTPTDNNYVDGGILSNLPNYLFSKEPHYNRILCIRNQGNTSNHAITSIEEYFQSLVDTIVSGAVDIQQKFTSESYEVTIETGDLSATDFDKIDGSVIDNLISAGAKAMDDFLDAEKSFVKNHPVDSMSVLHTEEQMHSMISYLSLEKHDEICICCDNTYWSWSLFLSVVKWIQDKTRVCIFTLKSFQPKYEQEEKARRRMLMAMGCVMRELDELPMNGFFFSNNNIWSNIIYQKNGNGFNGFFMKNIILSPMIQELLIKIKSENNILTSSKSSSNAKNSIDIVQIPEDDVLNMLRNETAYESADLSFETVELSKLTLMNPLIRALKYKQLSLLFDAYSKKQIDRFGSAAFLFNNGKKSLIGPPLVEVHNDKYYVIEGNTRCTYAFRHGMESLRMVVARNVDKQLPCNQDDSYSISQIIISDKKLKGEDRYEDFDYALFRHIEKALRPYDTYML